MKTENQADFRILGETDDFLAVDKPAGLLVHPTRPDGPTTLWDGLRALLLYELATGGQISIINRLDRETSGVVLIAKCLNAAREASKAMQKGLFTKSYQAMVFGCPEWDDMEVDAPIVRRGEVVPDAPVHLERMVHPTGQSARTVFRVMERRVTPDGLRFSLLAARPLTGRTHQIRVHAASLGFPLLGDKIYARGSGHYLDFIETGWTLRLAEALRFPRHALHCAEMSFAELRWTSPLPEDMAEFLRDSVPFSRP